MPEITAIDGEGTRVTGFSMTQDNGTIVNGLWNGDAWELYKLDFQAGTCECALISCARYPDREMVTAIILSGQLTWR